jgi:aminopeptidase YwaD
MNFSGEKALEYVHGMTQKVGTRFAGTEGEKKGAEYLLGLFKQFGYEDAKLQPFPIDLYQVWDEKLVVDGLGEVPCKGFIAATDCPNGVTGELVYLETGDECDIDTDVAGKIAIVTGGVGGKRLRSLIQKKVAGVIAIEMTPHVRPRRGGFGHEGSMRYGNLPGVRVTYEWGETLMGARGKKATISLRSKYTLTEAYNVVAELKGTSESEDIILICGHCDSIYDSQGTLDNAGGTAIVMELARIFKQIGSKRTLRFIAFSGEEQGLRGSVYYARELRKADKAAKKADKDFVLKGGMTELDRHRLVINIDIQGALIANNTAWISGPLDLAAAVRLLAAETGPQFAIQEACYSSDNAPMSDAGVPAISFGRGGPANFWGHTDEDVYQLCSAEGLNVSGEFILKYMRRYITESRTIPFERTIPDEHKKHVANYFKDRIMLRMDEGIDSE